MTDIGDLYEPGDDREPVEPDGNEQWEPGVARADLVEIEQRLKRLSFLAAPFGVVATVATLNGTQDLEDLARLVGEDVYGLIADLHAARERLAEWEALPVREVWALSSDRDTPPDEAAYSFRNVHTAFGYAERDGKTVWRRLLPLRPYERIDSKSPF